MNLEVTKEDYELICRSITMSVIHFAEMEEKNEDFLKQYYKSQLDSYVYLLKKLSQNNDEEYKAK